MNDSTKVSAAKPRINGAIYIAPLTATLPTDATSELTGFESLGYVSTDGVTNTNAPSVTNIKEWGGADVLSISSDRADTWKYKLIEALNVTVLKQVYGDDNVTGTLETGITVKARNIDLPDKAIVIDMIMRDGALKRIVIAKGSVSGIDDIVYNGTDAVGYGLTITAKPDSDGVTHYEYIARTNG